MVFCLFRLRSQANPYKYKFIFITNLCFVLELYLILTKNSARKKMRFPRHPRHGSSHSFYSIWFHDILIFLHTKLSKQMFSFLVFFLIKSKGLHLFKKMIRFNIPDKLFNGTSQSNNWIGAFDNFTAAPFILIIIFFSPSFCYCHCSTHHDNFLFSLITSIFFLFSPAIKKVYSVIFIAFGGTSVRNAHWDRRCSFFASWFAPLEKWTLKSSRRFFFLLLIALGSNTIFYIAFKKLKVS